MNKQRFRFSEIIALISVALTVIAFFIFMDKIPVEVQTLGIIVIAITLLEGIGLKPVADYMQLESSFLVYIPFIRHYKIGEIIQYAGYETLGKLRLSFATLSLTLISFIGSMLLNPGTLKAILIVLSMVAALVHIITRVIYVFLLTKMLSGTGLAIASLFIVSHPFIIFKYRFEIREIVKAESNEEYEDDSNESDQDYDYEEEIDEEDDRY